ncbi:DnaA ATPase domain-containing protein [Ponticoccus alexandrii]|uniref:Chromosomal replication initiator DnaA n=1 Tax=Ponticoccus alexandrii TaxID=1943633 RepID=A0ABX7FAN0_9RHOB|nr:DnaA/Hda family protein [Ponticoccus alexandrii]ETA51648.1 chromosomal replication initiator protein DnaA [Rhodobacteraceae bacterium PD-2]QRF66609.1 chromosomal replication initiator DnaA [Ponticoccus alexandrii]
MSGPEQLPLPLPALEALGREDFFVSPANALAVAQVEAWRDWPSRKMVVYGPEGSGKTHLAHVWASLSGARIVEATALSEDSVPGLAEAPACVENVDAIAGNAACERALFHLHNLCLAQGHALLMTAAREPAGWRLGLPDLQSRVQGAQAARLSEPDDLLLTMLLAKLLADHQTQVRPDVIPYLVSHMPRSYSAARALAEALSADSLATKKPVSRRMAAEALERLGPGL